MDDENTQNTPADVSTPPVTLAPEPSAPTPAQTSDNEQTTPATAETSTESADATTAEPAPNQTTPNQTENQPTDESSDAEQQAPRATDVSPTEPTEPTPSEQTQGPSQPETPTESAPAIPESPSPAPAAPIPPVPQPQSPAQPPQTPQPVPQSTQNIDQTALIHNLQTKARAKIQEHRQKKLEKVIEDAQQHQTVTNDEVQKLTRVSDATATRYLVDLVKQGRLVREGSPRHAKYRFLR